VELIDGYVVTKMPKKPEHSWTTKALLRMLEGLLPPEFTSQKEEAVRIPNYDEPEPDITLLRGSDDDYRHRTAVGTDAALAVEISDSTLAQDRGRKSLAYATAGIPVYWIVNLVDRQVEVYTDPGPAGYASHQVYLPGQQVPVVVDGRQIGQVAVNAILP
jgi:Uma2 family endonuclease